MQISFFEEFPDKNSLSKLKFIRFPTKIYLAAKSLKQFQKLKVQIKSKQVKEVVYWPILENKEGYWISPWSKRKALKRIFLELEGKKISVMLDLELPFRRNPWLFITQKAYFFSNKKLIRNFIDNYLGEVYLAEYYPEGKFKESVMKFWGLHYSSQKTKIIKMLYHSLHHFNKEFLVKELRRGKQEFGNNYFLAFGTIAQGINENEALLSAKQLQQDLQLAKEIGIKEVIIFRLGGLNKEYVKVISEFV
ncbi:MAG: hypothetical protein V2A62_04680 [Candidatus Woesearchaeota archaeon]